MIDTRVTEEEAEHKLETDLYMKMKTVKEKGGEGEGTLMALGATDFLTQ